MKKRYYVFITVAVILIAAVAAFCYLTSDVFVRSQVIKACRDSLNAEVEVDGASLAVFQGLEVRGLRLWSTKGPGGKGAPLLEVPFLRCDINPWSLISGTLTIRRLEIEKPIIYVERFGDGSVNWQYAVREAEAGEPAAIRLFPEGVWLRSATVHYLDKTVFTDGRPRSLERLSLLLRPRADDFSEFDFEGEVAGGVFRGVTVRGWLESDEEGEYPDLEVRFRVPGLEIQAVCRQCLPPKMARAVEEMSLEGSIWGNVNMALRPGSAPRFTGAVAVANVAAKPPWFPVNIESLAMPLRFDGLRLQSGSWVGRISKGTSHGAFQIHVPGSAPPTFWVQATVNNARLSEVAKRLPAGREKLRGLLDVQTELEGTIGDPESMAGWLDCELVEAHLAEMPVFVGLLNVLSLTLPSKPVFDMGEVRARIVDGAVHIDRMLFSSLAMEVTAKGRIGFDGSMDLVVFVATSKRADSSWLPIALVKKVFQTVIGGLQQTITPPVRVTGTIDKPKFSLMAFEPLTRPLRAISDIFSFLPFMPGKDTPEEGTRDGSKRTP